jgi:uncharacterized protein YdeI (BOF family)
MESIRRFALVAVVMLALSAAGQTLAASPFGTIARPVGFSQDQNNPAPALSLFIGTIQKNGDRFVFNDEGTQSSYKIDDQKAASKFDGKRVKIVGTLDARNQVIRVQNIEAATA